MATEAGAGKRRAARQAWLRLQWLLLCCATLAAAFALQDGALRLTDRIIYDRLVAALQRPAPQDIVIVAIDDRSIAELGRWPWKRGLHAQLINVLGPAGPRAIGLDLLLTEPDANSASGDRALAAALTRYRLAILPVLSTQTEAGLTARLPIAPLAAAAAGLAHIQLKVDEDGRVRAMEPYLTLGRYHWKSFGLAVRQMEQADAGPWPRNPDREDSALRIPFFGPAGHFTQVSYVDVLHAAIPASFFHGKTVLVGVTAAGLGDLYAVPQGVGHGLMAGVEIHANVLGALREGRAIVNAPYAIGVAFAALPALLVLLAFTFLSPRSALLLTGALTLVVALTSIVLLRHDLWLPPSAALLLLWLIYPLWSWRRLESALRYLDEETTRLATRAPFEIHPRTARRRWDFLERRIEAARTATHRVLDLHQFVSDNLDSMPDANLVISREGRLLLFNRKALELFAGLGVGLERKLAIGELMKHIAGAGTHDWPALLMPAHGAPAPLEITDPGQRIFSVRSTPSHNARGAAIGWIVSLADLTALRNAERQRDLSLNFISHDMRAPQSSILAMLALYREEKSTMDQRTLFARIEKSVRSTLALADDFVLLARAQSGHRQQEELNLDTLLADAADEMWALARERGALVGIESDGLPHWTRGERQMLVRALANLISNAIKYGPEQGRIRCRLMLEKTAEAAAIVCSIEDQGHGLPSDAGIVFTPFYRADATRQPGAGLGLSFVQTVAQLHGGGVTAENREDGGARFTLRLPALPEEAS